MLASTTTGPLPDLLSEPAILPRAELSARVVAHAQTRSWGAVADLLTEAELSSLPQHCVFLTRALQGLALINAHQYPLASAALDRRGAPAPIEPALAPLLTALADIASRLAAGDLSTADAAAAHAAAALAHWPAPSDALADALGTAAERAALQRGLDDLPTLARIARVAALVAGAASVPERTVRTQLAWPAKVALEPFIAALGGYVTALSLALMTCFDAEYDITLAFIFDLFLVL